MSTQVDDIKQAAQSANELLGQIGARRRERLRREKALEEEVQKLKDEHGPEIDRLKEEEQTLISLLKDLVLPRFALLAPAGAKTIPLRNGEIRLRESSRSTLVIAEGESEDDIIKRIRRHGGVRRFLRVKWELDKEALKTAPEFVAKIKGLSIVRKTALLIRPAEVQGETIKEQDPLNVPVASVMQD